MPQNNANLYAIFRQHFPQDLNTTLLTTESGLTFSYQDAENESRKMAHCLIEHGLKPGDRVTVQVEKSVEMLWLYLGCLRAGLVFHPLNTAYSPTELAFFLSNAKPGLVICTPDAEQQMYSLAQQHCHAKVLTLGITGEGSLIEALGVGDNSFDCVQSKPTDLAALLYSSGTTGRPKGIMLTHSNLSSNALTLIDAWGFSANDVLLHALPIFHVHGLFVGISCVLMSAASMRWLPTFNLDQIIAQLPQSTVMMGVPTYYTRLLGSDSFGRNSCQNMRLFISGSAPLLTETFIAFKEKSGHTILERYGMTETGMNLSNPLNDECRAGTVGFPLPEVSARIVNNEGEILAPDEIGNLQIKGPNVFKGYWQMPEKTAEDFTDDGFFNTGDKATISADGYYSIVGRAKDMVICGGLNVYPKEVELVIDDIPGVLESAVVGVSHSDFGEAVIAIVVADGENKDLDEDSIISMASEKLANFKTPKRVIFVEALPRNTMGKVQKNLLRDNHKDLFT